MTKSALFLVGVAILLAVFLSGCTVPAQTPSDNTQLQGDANLKNYPVQIQNSDFVPATVTIKVGNSVSWENYDGSPHSVTSDIGNELDSNLIQKGQTYEHTFAVPGTYAYHCSIHPSMKGTVIVQ